MENTELSQKLEATETELAAAKEQLAAKQAELQKAFDDIAELRTQAFNECVAKNFDLDALPATVAAWLLDLLRWSCGSTEEVAANLVAVAGCVKTAGAAPANEGGAPGEGTDDAAIMPTLPKPIFSSLEGAAAEGQEPAAEVPAAAEESAASEEAAPETASEEATAEVETETETETAVVTDTAAAAVVNIATGSKTPSGIQKWTTKHF